MEHKRPLQSLSDDELLRRLADLLHGSRRTEADLVAHIGEVDLRRLFAREACPSMFAYCTERLHLSEAEAYLRITAARAAREHPMLLVMLTDGRLHLSAIARLAPHLTVESRETILGRAAHMSKRQIEELVAELAPRPDVPALVRRLPERRPVPSALRPDASRGLTPAAKGFAFSLLPTPPAELRPDGVATTAAGPPAVRPGANRGLTPPAEGCGLSLLPTAPAELCPDRVAPERERNRPATIEPLAPGRFRIQFTGSAELRDKLERLQSLMRSSVPDGDLAAVIDSAVTEKLQRLEARRFARTSRPRGALTPGPTPPQHGVPPTSRHIPAAVRRAAHERDEGRCRYLDAQGRRCTAREGLELHHRYPYGHGGGHSLENLCLMCRAHNSYLAEADYGARVMGSQRRHSNPVSRSPSVARPASEA